MYVYCIVYHMSCGHDHDDDHHHDDDHDSPTNYYCNVIELSSNCKYQPNLE